MAPQMLEINPESELEFVLSHNEATPRCVLTLRHPGNSDQHLAFKVKTTQPRRYLVRPNQGLIAPHGSEDISILLVEKDKQVLLQSFERLGQSGLDNSKDKFLVQSCSVSSAFTSKIGKDSNELYEALTGMWNSVSSSGSSAPLYNKKLHVRHVVNDSGSPQASSQAPSSGFKPDAAPKLDIENMSEDQSKAELRKLRNKYDELVSFSVNLTAERDIISNTLEQTKRDFNREVSTRSALENKQGSAGATGSASGGKSIVGLFFQLLVVAVAALLAGIRMGTTGQASFLDGIPGLEWFAEGEESNQGFISEMTEAVGA